MTGRSATLPLPAQADGRDTRGDTVTVSELGRLLRRGWRTIGVTTLVAILLGGAYALLAPTRYTAGLAILFDMRQRTLPGGEQAFNASLTDLALVESQVKVIGSPAVLRRVIESEQLLTDAEFGAPPPGLLSSLLGTITGGRDDPDVTSRRMVQTMQNLSRALTIRRSERTYVVELEVLAGDPVKAARLANAIANAYLLDRIEARADTARREGAVVRARLDDLQRQVREAEQRLVDYRRDQRITTADGRLIDDLTLTETQEALVAARNRRAEAQARADQAALLQRGGALPEQLPEALRSGVVERLRAQLADIGRQEANLRRTLGPRHPTYLEVQEQAQETRRLLGDELRRIAAAAASELAVARANEAQLEAQLESVRRSSDETSQRAVRLRDLEREFESSRAVLDRFLRAREAVGVEAIEAMNARIVAEAVPPLRPSAPRRTLILALAAMVGLVSGVGMVLVRDGADGFADDPVLAARDPPPPPSARSEDPNGAEDAVLGSAAPVQQVPDFAPPLRPAGFRGWFGFRGSGTLGAADRLTDAVLRPDQAFARFVDGLLARILAASPLARTVMVVADRPGLGVTTLASNLAWRAAQEGRLVLLIDAHRASPALSRQVADHAPAGTMTLDGRRVLVRCLGPDWRTGPLLVPAAGVATPSRTEDLDALGLMPGLVVVDTPPLADPGAEALVAAADRLILLSAADKASLVPVVARWDRPPGRLLAVLRPPARAA